MLKPMLAGTRETLAALGGQGDVLRGKALMADNGYHSEKNVRLVLEDRTDTYLPDNLFRKRDPAFADAQRYKRSTDRKKTDWRVCELRAKCLRHPHTPARQVTLFEGRGPKAAKSFTEQMIERFDTATARFLYSRRVGIVEPVFANVYHALGLAALQHAREAEGGHSVEAFQNGSQPEEARPLWSALRARTGLRAAGAKAGCAQARRRRGKPRCEMKGSETEMTLGVISKRILLRH